MPQNLTTPGTGFSGEVPADLACGFCKKSIQGEFYRALNRFTCPACAGQLQNVIDRNAFSPEPFAKAAGAGLAVGLACAAAWAAIVQITHFEVGIVASLIGYAVGKAVFTASGKRRGRALPWLAAILSVVGIVGGKVMLVAWQFVEVLNQRGIPINPLGVTRIVMSYVVNNPTKVFSGFDLLWIAFAVYAAWKLCQAPPITIAGPYPHTPPRGPALQFHTIEPATPLAAPATAPPPAPEQP